MHNGYKKVPEVMLSLDLSPKVAHLELLHNLNVFFSETTWLIQLKFHKEYHLNMALSLRSHDQNGLK